VVYYFEEYPLEKIMIGLSIINSIDLARVLFLIKFNISALMGYTGAVFHKFFGSIIGILVSIFFLLIWIVIPLFISTKFFSKKDF
jgi:Cu-processing system permease protein